MLGTGERVHQGLSVRTVGDIGQGVCIGVQHWVDETNRSLACRSSSFVDLQTNISLYRVLKSCTGTKITCEDRAVIKPHRTVRKI